ncbi:Polymer-forming protein [Parapedobacter koreensis]|uniref:Polymer-forming protein n=1 Tax=Parapedobacter koreensis TaxID=332977 RepID=A0A1H7NU16_9SPHI|nr:Polymer-forming protein [Parapedobacter koreensis]
MIDFFKKKAFKKSTSEAQEPQQNEIIVTEQDTISLTSMILVNKRQGNFYVREVATVATNAYISGAIVSSEGVIRGRVTGNITCTGNLLIASTAIIEGAVAAKSTTIESGAIINGTMSVIDEAPASLLAEKIRLAEKLLGNGYTPAIEPIEVPAAMSPSALNEVRKTPGKTNHSKTPGKNNVNNQALKSTGATKPPTAPDQHSATGGDQAGGWW